MNTPLLAFHGDPAIKERYLARVRTHRAADDIIRGTYGSAEGKSGWRGCAVGCTLHGNSHAAYEAELGVPRVLAHLEDTLFERMPIASALDWPVEFLEAIPIGADLSLVVWQLLARGIRDLLRFATDATRPAMERVIAEVLAPKARGEEVSEETARVASAAYAAAGAGAAARAAYAAAYAAMAYQWSRWLLELMAAAPVPVQPEATR